MSTADPTTAGGERRVGETYAESTPSWPRCHIPADAPNVVMIVLDDVGFGQLGCYGSSIRTPAIDRLAEEGVRYTNFHVTTLCSPTRASLLTGRNHHSVGMGFLSGFDTGFDSYRGHVSSDAATLARMLQEEGYGTYAVGKWHLTPASDMTPSGPFQHWPLRRGFDRYYGFLWGEDDHWSPQLWSDNQAVDPPRYEGYHLTDDLVGRSQQFIADHLSSAPDRPYFLYLALGAGHAPHQAPREEIERYSGTFDDGWDVERERVLARQTAMGIVPAGTALPPSNPDVRPWETLSADERRLYSRMQEVFAGFMSHADRALGRLLDFLRDLGQLEDTLVIVLSDNGASGQGGPHGSVNEYRHLVGIPDSLEDNLAAIDALGGPDSHGHYPSGWAQAGNTPLRYYKKYNYGGGVRAPLIIRWPERTKARGEVRTQFHHVVDVTPTVLEACRVTPRAEYDGIRQQTVHGTSMLYTVDDRSAVTRRPQQYFEMAGHRGMWWNGWKAVTNHRIGAPYRGEPWELYDLRTDFAESNDVSADYPDVVERLDALWWEEAARFGVLPLDDRFQQRATDRGPDAFRRRFRLHSGARIFSPVAGPNFADRSFAITADVVRTAPSDDGALLAHGRRAAGFALYVHDNRLHLHYNRAGHHQHLQSAGELPVGRAELGLVMRRIASGKGHATLTVDGAPVAEGPIDTMLGGFGGLSTQCGHNSPSTVSRDIAPPFEFSGTLRRVDIEFFDDAHTDGEAVRIDADLHHE